MTPAGYLYKRIARPTDDAVGDWFRSKPHVRDICSVSGCISENFHDYIDHWRHNACWLFDDPLIMRAIADEEGVAMQGLSLFYYERFEQEWDASRKAWVDIAVGSAAMDGLGMSITPPRDQTLLGYDVNCASQNNVPECSPLSCNHVCTAVAVNEHCLFHTFDEARQALENGVFDNSEPGPYRIYAVYSASDSR